MRSTRINRRRFIVLGGGVAACLFAAGHKRPPQVAITRDAGFAGEPRQAVPAVREPAAATAYRAPLTDHHPDDFVVDQVAPPQAAVAAPLDPPADIVASAEQRRVINQVRARLQRLQQYVGHGNFNIIGWDESLRLARNQSQIGAFTHAELELIEEVFATDAQTLGFYGDKVVERLSATIPRQDVVKIPGSGHFLFKGQSTATYEKIRRDVGDSLLLTSGIRSVVKQIHLYLNKVENVDGNLTLASYSLAPPGHSYHAVGDFDVGKKGFGVKNFSADFADTDEFRRLIDLGYLDIRYTLENPFGVRYEPWHIKIV